MTADPLTVAAWELVAGVLRSEELPALATDALARGVDSPTLGELAAQDPSDVRDSRDLFIRVLGELAVELPDRDSALWNLVRDTACAVVDGVSTPEAGARTIWSLAWDLEDSGDLRIFVGLASALEDHPDDRAHLEGQVITAAVELLRRPRPRVWIQLQAVNAESVLSRSVRSGSVSTDPADLPISKALRSELAAWQAEHAEILADWPHRGGFESTADAERFVDTGHRLMSELQHELGPDYHVEYMPEPIRPPGIKLRSAQAH